MDINLGLKIISVILHWKQDRETNLLKLKKEKQKNKEKKNISSRRCEDINSAVQFSYRQYELPVLLKPQGNTNEMAS